MKTNLKLESSPFCYVYSKYKIEEINGKRYVMPEEKAARKAISITEHIDDLLIETLNIGKKEFFRQPIGTTNTPFSVLYAVLVAVTIIINVGSFNLGF